MQLLAAIVATGDIQTVRKKGLKVDHLISPMGKLGLSRILDYSASATSLGQVPSISWLNEHGIAFHKLYDPTLGTVAAMVDAAKTAYLKQQLLSLVTSVSQQAAADPFTAYQNLLAALHDRKYVELTSSGIESQFADLAPKILQFHLDTIHTGGMLGVMTPWPTVNKSLKGLKAGNLYVLFGPPKNYKTFSLLAQAIHVYKVLQRRVLVVTSEMPFDEMGARIYCGLNQLDFNQWLDRTLPTSVLQDLQDDLVVLQNRKNSDLHLFMPSGRGEQAVSEVAAKIKDVNHDGQLALVVWDGHYRSADSEEWHDVYNLVRRTRAMILDPATGQPPLLISAQEGSKKGVVNMKAYEQEASAVISQEKLDGNRAVMRSVYLREGKGFRCDLTMDFKSTSMVEDSGELEDSSGSPGSQGFV